jgi:1-deoxy-D-xylulose-5-phosphate reductoisomerase
MKKKAAVLGATGSIGKSALDVIQQGCTQGKNDFEVVLLSAHRNGEALDEAGRLWPAAEKVLSGAEGGRERLLSAIAACNADIVLNGIIGAAGLEPSAAAVEAGCDLALANKETLVMAGYLIMQRAREKNVSIIPVDSEHSAVFHLIEAHGTESLDEIILTASGGPFRNSTIEEMEKAGPADALAHPTWNMGAKISIDSASMANKGLEVIEAARLFGIAVEKIKVVIHHQSIVHSMVKMKDGAVYAQLSKPDMRLPIYKALYRGQGTGNRECGVLPWQLDFNAAITLEFYPPDMDRFPLLSLAREAVKKGGMYPCAYNAANEAAVAAFLAGRIGFLDIGRITQYVLDNDWSVEPVDIASVMEADRQARVCAENKIIKVHK